MVQPHSILDIPDEGTVLEPVVGGSGNLYLSIAAAIAGESAVVGQADRITGVVPQAGTTAGSIVGPGTLSAVDEFYKDYYVVNTDTTPTNGLVSQWARVSSYVGASRTLTLDKPFNFATESAFALVKVIRIGLLKDVAEDVSVAVNFELNLAGHRLEGKVDITAQEFHWIRGAGGYITNGVQKTSFGLLKIDDCKISRRDATVYAALMTEGSNLGRCEVMGCEFFGRVAARRGFMGWRVDYCKNFGCTDDAKTDTPYALVESVGAVSIALSSLDVGINGEFAGAFLYDEVSITGATVFMSVFARVTTPADYLGLVVSPKKVSLLKVVGGATATITVTGGTINIEAYGYLNSAGTTGTDSIQGLLFISAFNYTGTCSFLINTIATNISLSGSMLFRTICPEGTKMSGSVTFGGSGGKGIRGAGTATDFAHFMLTAEVSGTLIVSGGSFSVKAFSNASISDSDHVSPSGAPVFTVSAGLAITNVSNWFGDLTTSGTFTVGTWSISGDISIKTSGMNNTMFGLGLNTSGGTYTFSGDIRIQQCFNLLNPSPAAVRFAVHSGTGGTVTLSGQVEMHGMSRQGGFTLCLVDGAGATVVVSSALINISNLWVAGAGDFFIGSAQTATSTGSVTGVIVCDNVVFDNTVALLRASPAGASMTGPSSLTFFHCTFENTLTSQSGAGTLAWGASAALKFSFCHIEGLYTLVATPFTTHQAFHSRFNGNSSNNCITASGTRPTTYQFWKCSYNAVISGLTPSVIDDYAVVPANAALTKGNLASINASAKAIAALASSVVEGVVLADVAGANNPAILVRRGKVMVSSNATVAAGDSCVLDVVTTPTNQIAGAAVTGQRVGRALEAVGATTANLAWTDVNLM